VSPEHVTECPTCTCACPTLTPIVQATPYIMESSATNDSRGGDEVLNDDYDEAIDNNLNAAVVVQDFSPQQLPSLSAPLQIEPDVTSTKSEETESSLSLTKAVTIAVVTGLASLVLGFLSGFFISRLCSHKSSASVTSSNVSLVKPCPLDKPVNVDSGYTTPTNCDNNNSKNINILMNNSNNQSKPTSTVSSKLERTKLSCTGTLQKVKRVYL